MIKHVNYPHEPGYLYDCPACEAQRHDMDWHLTWSQHDLGHVGVWVERSHDCEDD